MTLREIHGYRKSKPFDNFSAPVIWYSLRASIYAGGRFRAYALGFTVNHIAFYTILRLWRRDFRALLAIYSGLSKGFRTSLIPSAESERLCADHVSGTNEAIGNADH